MTQTLIPAPLLQNPERVLFIAHLALGDFTYLQNFFKAFAAAHPHLKLHLWVDEVRRTNDASQWEHLRKYALYDWVQACGLFEKVYTRTYSPALLKESIYEAQQETYPLVISLATLRPHLYAALAREIAGKGFVAGMKRKVRFYQPHHYLAYHKLDAAIAPSRLRGEYHITDTYADWFLQLAGLEVPKSERFPYVDIPAQWMDHARDQLQAWGFRTTTGAGGKLVFVNPYAKTIKRCWPLEKIAALIKTMQQQPAWRDACFIINAVPQELDNARRVFKRHALERTQLFSAEDNFFQLPALLSQCNLIISVETAVMHLANAVHVPVIALMRQKNPEWVPIDKEHSTVITALRRKDWVDAITVEQVIAHL